MHGSIAYKAILFGILTASRTIEFVPARWGEINWATKVWSVPPERRKDKKKEPHRVPLSNQAIELLQSIRGSRIMNPNGFIFLSSYGWHITQDTPRIFLQRTLLRSVTMHGCRSTFRDWAAENGKNDVVAEKCLMHATGSTVVQAYQRSDLLKLRRVCCRNGPTSSSALRLNAKRICQSCRGICRGRNPVVFVPIMRSDDSASGLPFLFREY